MKHHLPTECALLMAFLFLLKQLQIMPHLPGGVSSANIGYRQRACGSEQISFANEVS